MSDIVLTCEQCGNDTEFQAHVYSEGVVYVECNVCEATTKWGEE